MPKTTDVTSSVREGKRKDALTASLKGAKRLDQIPSNTRWKYDNPSFRHSFESGRAHVDPDDAFCNFIDWLSIEHKLTFENMITGESFTCIGSKRGNKQFAIKKWKKVKLINDAMKDRHFDFEIPSHRNIYRNCHLLLITLTFKQDISIEQAWFLTSAKGKAQNKFKANLAKILGSKATVCAKEAQSNGYPAPHILVFLDNPVRVKHHKGKKGKSWRLEDREFLERIKKAWPWGFLDVEAVISSRNGKYWGYKTPVNYITKYMTKDVDLTKYPELKNARKIEDIPIKMRTPIYTHMWNKILRSRDFYVSKAFKDRLEIYTLSKKIKANDEQPCDWTLIGLESYVNSSFIFNPKHDCLNSRGIERGRII